jgi:hypothetical protein
LNELTNSEFVEDILDDAQPESVGDFVDSLGVNVGFGRYGDFELVGCGKVTNQYCGTFRNYLGCVREDLHERIDLNGVNYHDRGFVKLVFHSCDKPSCPVCYRRGWAVREARKVDLRLKEAGKTWGEVEHILCSLPLKDYSLSYQSQVNKAVKVLLSRGVVGGVLMYHAFRFNWSRYWYYSPHFHVLGFVLGGYGRCRNCEHKSKCVKGCGGFDDVSYQQFLKNGYFVKVFGKRITVSGTALYQLNHSALRVSSKRANVATWFGVCSYRKLKVTAEVRKQLCPICNSELVRLNYLGVVPIVKVRDAVDFVGRFYVDLFAGDGSPNWCEMFGSRYER